jgi:hypothetical protein
MMLKQEWGPSQPDGQITESCPAPPRKIFRFSPDPNQIYINRHPSHTEGRFAIVTDVGCGMRWTRQCQARKCWTKDADAYGEVVWSWRPDAGVKFSGVIRWMTVAKEPGHRGEHEGSRKTIARGKPGVSVWTCSDYARVLCFISHARLRVQRAPGFPCALAFRGTMFVHSLGASRRENANLCLMNTRATFSIVITCVQSSSPAHSRGLSARNDGVRL